MSERTWVKLESTVLNNRHRKTSSTCPTSIRTLKPFPSGFPRLERRAEQVSKGMRSRSARGWGTLKEHPSGTLPTAEGQQITVSCISNASAKLHCGNFVCFHFYTIYGSVSGSKQACIPNVNICLLNEVLDKVRACL